MARPHMMPRIAGGVAIVLPLVFAAFGLHVAQGGSSEMRTVSATALRSTVWGGIAPVAPQALSGR